jgi:SNF2 family DNA or RNA helicase
VQEAVAQGGFDLIIIDEATHYKNPQTKRWKVMNALLGPDTWMWMMTGTPAAQSPLDAYGLAKMLNPNSVPRFMGTFKQQVMWQVTRFKWVPKDDATETVFNALRPAIRFTKDECLDLPEMTYVKREVPLTAQQKKYYQQLHDQMMLQADGEEVTAANAAIMMNKLMQISCGAVYSDDRETIEFDISNRYKVLREVIDESSQKVLIFVPFKHTIEILVQRLRKDKITADFISGDVSASKRTALFKQFQEQPDPRVLV